MTGHGIPRPGSRRKVPELTRSRGSGHSSGRTSVTTSASSDCPGMVPRPRRHRRVVLGGPPGTGQDHPRTALLEQLETEPAHFLPEQTWPDRLLGGTGEVVIALPPGGHYPRRAGPAHLLEAPISCLHRPMVVARDIAHAKIKAAGRWRADAGVTLKDHCVYYAGPARPRRLVRRAAPSARRPPDAWTPMSISSRRPGGSWSCSPKAIRSTQVTDACRTHGLSRLHRRTSRPARQDASSPSVLEYPELGMEAVWRIEVEDFPLHRRRRQRHDFFATTAKSPSERRCPSARALMTLIPDSSRARVRRSLAANAAFAEDFALGVSTDSQGGCRRRHDAWTAGSIRWGCSA